MLQMWFSSYHISLQIIYLMCMLPFTPRDQYAYSPYCSLYVSHGSYNKNLFNNQELLIFEVFSLILSGLLYLLFQFTAQKVSHYNFLWVECIFFAPFAFVPKIILYSFTLLLTFLQLWMDYVTHISQGIYGSCVTELDSPLTETSSWYDFEHLALREGYWSSSRQ